MAKQRADIQYEVQVWTSDVRGAGTDADVFIQISGTDGQTDKIGLHDNSNNFEQGKRDNFVLKAPDVGNIQKIRIGHNAENLMSGWHLQKVFIKKHINSNSKPKKEEKKENKEKGNSDITEYWFFVNRWFDTSEDDKQIERELIPTDEKGNPIQSPTANKPEGSEQMSKSRAEEKDVFVPKENENPDEETKDETYVATERTNNRDDPFYVPSAYDKDPKAELETIRNHRNRQKPVTRAPPRKIQSRKSELDSSLAKPVHSPILEEKTQSLLEVHTENQEYFTNDFDHSDSPERTSPSGISEYLDMDSAIISDKAVGSIRRTMQLLF